MKRKTTGRSLSQTKRVRFELEAPEARSVHLAGDFNAWNIRRTSMKKDEKGVWKVSVNLEPGRREYRFYVDDRWHDDPGADERVNNPFGTQNCVKIVG